MKITLLNALLILIFLASGGAKLASLEFELVAFERWGYPLWFMYLTGALEVAGALALIVRKTQALAALCLTGLMGGAVLTHLIHSEWAMLVLAALIMLASFARAWLGCSKIRAFFGRSESL